MAAWYPTPMRYERTRVLRRLSAAKVHGRSSSLPMSLSTSWQMRPMEWNTAGRRATNAETDSQHASQVPGQRIKPSPVLMIDNPIVQSRWQEYGGLSGRSSHDRMAGGHRG